MPTTYGGANTWGTAITIPVDGDKKNAASVQVGFQGLADRTVYLKNRLPTLLHMGVFTYGASLSLLPLPASNATLTTIASTTSATMVNAGVAKVVITSSQIQQSDIFYVSMGGLFSTPSGGSNIAFALGIGAQPDALSVFDIVNSQRGAYVQTLAFVTSVQTSCQFSFSTLSVTPASSATFYARIACDGTNQINLCSPFNIVVQWLRPTPP